MAIETVLYLGKRKDNSYMRSEVIAKKMKLSLGYLQKVIQNLGRIGILECKAGRSGGIKIRRKVVTLLDIWEVTFGSLDFSNPPVAMMDKPLKAFAAALREVIIYRRK